MKSLLTTSVATLAALTIILAADASYGDSKKKSSGGFNRSRSSQGHNQKSTQHRYSTQTRHQKGSTKTWKPTISTQQKHNLHQKLFVPQKTQHAQKTNHNNKYNLIHKAQQHQTYKLSFKPTHAKPHIQIGGQHHKARVCLPLKDWCHTRPGKCHWWYNYCESIRYRRPVDCVRYTCNYVTASYRLTSGVVVEDVRWHLGLSGILLPGKGFAIETVEENSPADQAGLQAGMVITAANGIEITDENSMPNAIAASNGVLQATVLVSIDAEPVEVTVEMQRVVVSSF